MTGYSRLHDFLASSSWSGALTDEQMSRVRRDAYLRDYQAGATVCARGQAAVHWMGVAEGMLKVDKIAEDGRSTTFAGVPSGAWFGEGAVLKGELRPYAVVAIRDSSVVFVPRATFQWLIDDSPSFSRWVIDQLNARLAYYVSLVETLRFQEAAARVAFCVSELFNPQLYPSTQSQLQISQEERAAQWVGSTEHQQGDPRVGSCRSAARPVRRHRDFGSAWASEFRADQLMPIRIDRRRCRSSN